MHRTEKQPPAWRRVGPENTQAVHATQKSTMLALFLRPYSDFHMQHKHMNADAVSRIIQRRIRQRSSVSETLPQRCDPKHPPGTLRSNHLLSESQARLPRKTSGNSYGEWAVRCQLSLIKDRNQMPAEDGSQMPAELSRELEPRRLCRATGFLHSSQPVGFFLYSQG